MSNMSYCRFENTLNDLRDCVGAMEEVENLSELDLNEYEKNAFMAMRRDAIEFLEQWERLNLID